MNIDNNLNANVFWCCGHHVCIPTGKQDCLYVDIKPRPHVFRFVCICIRLYCTIHKRMLNAQTHAQ